MVNKGKISIIIPTYNEAENIPLLYERLKKVLDSLGTEYEILFIDDGSTDSSYELLVQLAHADEFISIISLHRNFGQTAAIQAGIDHARGDIIIILDADLQNPPEEIPRMLATFHEGYDCVSGWRKKRKDKYFTKVLPSHIANKIISFVSKLQLHDFGCTLKIYNARFLKKLYLNGDMHRFLPIFVFNLGGRVTEQPIDHHPRQYGKSKYSILKTIKVVLELCIITFMQHYSNKPIHFIGFLGLLCITASLIILGKVIVAVLCGTYSLNMLVLFFVLLNSGILFFLTGIIMDIVVKIYNKIDIAKIYTVKRVIKTGQHLNET